MTLSPEIKKQLKETHCDVHKEQEYKCDDCKSVYQKLYRKLTIVRDDDHSNHEEFHRRCYQCHLHRHKKYAKKFQQVHKEAISKRNKGIYNKNIEYYRAYNNRNKERRKLYQIEYNKKHRKRITDYYREYHRKKREAKDSN